MHDSGSPFTNTTGSFTEPPKRRLLRYLLIGLVAILSIVAIAMVAAQVLNNDDTKKPATAERPLTIAVNNLITGEEVTEKTVIKVTISEPARVERVAFYVDKAFAGVTYALPFDFTFDPKIYAEGEHAIVAKVYDKKGKSYTARTVTIIVKRSATATADPTPTPAPTPVPPASKPQAKPGSSSGSSSGGGSGGTETPVAPPDTAAPATPAGLVLTADGGYTVSLAWNAASDNVGVTGYQVYRDGVVLGAATTTAYTDQTVVPGNTYSYSLAALDAANNISGMSTQPSVTLIPTSIWVAADSPREFADDGSPLELGVKFKPLVNGKISGVRFYKAPGSTGTHVGNVWAAGGGAALRSVNFANETASGWQQAVFSTPLDVTAGTTYVVSYTSPSGKFGISSNYFTDAGITSQYLTAPSTGDASGNGVFASGAGVFPGSSFNGSNYWVDATFIPNTAAGGPTATTQDMSVTYTGFPGSNNTGVPAGKRLPIRDRSIVVHEDGAVIDGIQVNDMVEVRAEDVLIKNTRINGIAYLDKDLPGSGDWYMTIEDSTINAGTAQRGGVTLAQYTLRRVNIYGGQMSALCVTDCQVYDSWLHGQYLPANQDWHLGGFLSNGGSDMLLSHNTISCDTPNNLVGGGCSGNVNLYGDFSPIERVTVTGNLLTANAAAGYCAAFGYNANKPFGNGSNTLVVTNNIFQRGTSGVCAGFGSNTDYTINGVPAPNSTWTNNKWDDGTTVNPE